MQHLEVCKLTFIHTLKKNKRILIIYSRSCFFSTAQRWSKLKTCLSCQIVNESQPLCRFFLKLHMMLENGQLSGLYLDGNVLYMENVENIHENLKIQKQI